MAGYEDGEQTAGDRVRTRREELGFTQGEVSRRSGVRPETISRLEKNRQGLGAESAKKLAPVLKVRVGWLLEGDAAVPVAESRVEYASRTYQVVEDLIAAEGIEGEMAERLRSIQFGGVDPSYGLIRSIWIEEKAKDAGKLKGPEPVKTEIGSGKIRLK